MKPGVCQCDVDPLIDRSEGNVLCCTICHSGQAARFPARSAGPLIPAFLLT